MIYLVEDDSSIRELVAYTFNGMGIEMKCFELPSQFRKELAKALPDLIILDIMLPEEDGLSILKSLRNTSDTADIPIMMLTAKGGEYDKVIGLDSGADDYMTKPFGMMELVARVKALLRRTSKQEKGHKEYNIGKLYISPQKHRVSVDGKEIALTYKEFEMLCMLCENRGTVLTREKLLNTIWGYDFDGENRTVDVHIRTLRQKLGECGDYIETIRGIGYKMGETVL